MPRYLFRIHEGESPDHVEMDYPNAEHMRSEAVRLAGACIQDMQIDGIDNRGWSLQVTDESDQVVFSLTVTLTNGAT